MRGRLPEAAVMPASVVLTVTREDAHIVVDSHGELLADERTPTPADTLLDLDPQFCGGSNDALEAPIDAWIAPARDLFPATDVLALEGA